MNPLLLGENKARFFVAKSALGKDGRFQASDGLTYASPADRLLGRCEDSYRNAKIKELRAAAGHPDPERAVRSFIRWHDGARFATSDAPDEDWDSVTSFDPRDSGSGSDP